MSRLSFYDILYILSTKNKKGINSMQKNTRNILQYVLFGLIYTLGAAILTVCAWYAMTFDLEFKELLYTLASPLKGTGQSTVAQVVSACLPVVLFLVALYVVATLLLEKTIRRRYAKRIGAVFCACLLTSSLIFSVFALRIPGYLKALTEKTTIYEDYYVDPDTVAITANGKPKNLIYIYLESMETTYAAKRDGGTQAVNYMPGLTTLAQENISFSDKQDGLLGGFHTPLGTGWTMAALLATTSGVPFSFPLGENGHNDMVYRETFASGLTTLGDILAEKGYRQEFLCGSDSAFGGRKTYFEQHGNYEIFDLFTAREEDYIPDDYKVWWGFEDKHLYEIAKDELTELAASDQPFNFTMLTVDTHHIGGFTCTLCEYEHTDKLANVVSCADRQLASFVEWCREQDFYKDTVIVITGDHPRMDTILIGETDYYDRTIYNCFINAAASPAGEVTERTMTSFDLFPTTLAAMGFSIEGDRLGLGVNLFSTTPTLAEQFGYEWLETEINKFSDYYIREFS